MVKTIIIEGVTGAGKTSTIARLKSILSFKLIGEDDTFDDFMAELSHEPALAVASGRRRMRAILDEIGARDPALSDLCILERFHLSYYALSGDWEQYRDIDERCAALGCKVVLLAVPEGDLSERALYRAEYKHRDWQGFIERYGSESEALRALANSQQQRIDALDLSQLQSVVLNTSEKNWEAYARNIAEWI